MPYGKRRYYRKRPYRRYKKYSKSGSNWMNIAKKALSTAMFVKNLVNAETKHFETQTNLTMPAANTWNYTILNNIPQGTTSITRDGDSVKNKSLTIRGTIDIKDLTGGSKQRLRVALIKKKQAQWLPSSTELWTFPTDYNTPRNPNFMKQYKIIFEKKYQTGNEDGKRAFTFNWSFPLKSHTEYMPDGIAQNAYYLCVFCDVNPTYAPEIKYISKLTFIDN